MVYNRSTNRRNTKHNMKHREKGVISPEKQTKEEMDSELDLKLATTRIYNEDLNKDLTRDFTLAGSKGKGLQEKDIESMIEIIDLAYYLKSIIQRARRRLKQELENYYYTTKEREEEIEKIKHSEKMVFQTLLTKPRVATILARNTSINIMVNKIIGQTGEEEEGEELRGIEKWKREISEAIGKKE